MADWEEEDSGKTFGNTDSYQTSDHESGFQSSNDYSDDSNRRDGRFAGRGRGRGGGRGGRGGGGFRQNDDTDGDTESFGGRDNDDGERRGGRGGRGGGRGRGDRPRPATDGENGMDEVAAEKPKEFYVPDELTEDEIFESGISSGINFDNYAKIPIKVTGENIPDSINTFASSGLNSYLLQNIQKSKYTLPTPIQKHGIPIIMGKRDLMACAQTGSGKTAAFLLPILNMLMESQPSVAIGQPNVIIISPTRELTIQIYNEARKFATGSIIKICIAYGGTAVRVQGDNIRKGCHILVATPGRLLDFVDKAMITFENIQFVVLDEADRMLDMGFMPSIDKVMNHVTMSDRASRQTLMFSATFPREIQELAGQFLQNYVFVVVGIVGSACTDVEQVLYEVSKFEKRKKLQEILQSEDATGTMVFVETKRNADYLASLMSETVIPTTSIHGDRMQREREEALRDFKNGSMHVLIATSVAARGLDIKNVRHVINYDLPKSIDDYVHRIGRTGRVGNRGKATSFYEPEQDSALAADLVRILKDAGQEVPAFLESFGGGSSFKSSMYGGKDIRDGVPMASSAQPTRDEPDEDW